MSYIASSLFQRQVRGAIAVNGVSSSGLAIDAMAKVGGVYHLVSASNGNLICILKCATLGPITYTPLSPIYWRESASGTEFSGVFKPAVLGAATFGYTSGIIINGDGGIEIQGLTPFKGATRTVNNTVRLLSLSLVAGNFAGCGFIRSSAKTLMTGGGLAVNATPAYCCGAYVKTSLTVPTIAVNTAFLAAPSTAVDQIMGSTSDSQIAGSDGVVVRGGINQNGGQSQVWSVGSASLAGSATNEHILCFSGLGISYLIKETQFTGQT